MLLNVTNVHIFNKEKCIQIFNTIFFSESKNNINLNDVHFKLFSKYLALCHNF